MVHKCSIQNNIVTYEFMLTYGCETIFHAKLIQCVEANILHYG